MHIRSILATSAIIGMMSFNVSEPLPVGADLPKTNLKIKTVTDKEVTLKESKKANGLLVMFSCNTCPFVIRNQQRTKDILTFAEKNDIGIIILNSNEAKRGDDDSFESMKAYAKDQGYTWNYAVDKDNEIADAFGANRTPECFLFSKDLKLIYHGAIDDNPSDAQNITREHLKVAITEQVAGKEITIKESKSVGCTIKRKS